MWKRITNPIGRQTSVRQNMEFFSICQLMALLFMWRLFRKYCSSFWHLKPGKIIFSLSLCLKNRCFEKSYFLKTSSSVSILQGNLYLETIVEPKYNFDCHTRLVFQEKFEVEKMCLQSRESYNPGQIFGTKRSNLVKLDRKRKVSYLFLHAFNCYSQSLSSWSVTRY